MTTTSTAFLENPEIITIDLVGGLGNQFFQIATVIAFSAKHGIPFLFPYKEHHDNHWGYDRPTYWHNLFHSIINKTTKYTNHPFYRTNETLVQIPNKIHESMISYIHPPPPNRSFYLYGYFQNYHYFHSYRKYIINVLRIREQQNAIKQKYALRYFADKEDTTTIAIHFRMGDYKHIKGNVLKIGYYRKALHHLLLTHLFPNSKNSVKIIVFCEEEDRAEIQKKVISILQMELNIEMEFLFNRNAPPTATATATATTIEQIGQTTMPTPTTQIKNNNTTQTKQKQQTKLEFINIDTNIQDYEQMLLMSVCDYVITANSTFSWWSAYLSTNPPEHIYCPLQWSGDKTHNDNNNPLFVEGWNIIS